MWYCRSKLLRNNQERKNNRAAWIDSRINLQAPLRRPFCELSKAAFVTSLNPDVTAPDAADPAEKD